MNEKEKDELISNLINETSDENFLKLISNIYGLSRAISIMRLALTDSNFFDDEQMWTDEKLLELKKKLL